MSLFQFAHCADYDGKIDYLAFLSCGIHSLGVALRTLDAIGLATFLCKGDALVIA